MTELVHVETGNSYDDSITALHGTLLRVMSKYGLPAAGLESEDVPHETQPIHTSANTWTSLYRGGNEQDDPIEIITFNGGSQGPADVISTVRIEEHTAATVQEDDHIPLDENEIIRLTAVIDRVIVPTLAS